MERETDEPEFDLLVVETRTVRREAKESEIEEKRKWLSLRRTHLIQANELVQVGLEPQELRESRSVGVSFGDSDLERVPDELPELLVLLRLRGSDLGEEIERLLDQSSLKLVDESRRGDGVSRNGEAGTNERKVVSVQQRPSCLGW